MKKLISKIVKRARREFEYGLTQNVSFNHEYKPLGVKALVRHTTPVSEYFEFQAPYLSTLDLSQEFTEDCSPYMKPVKSLMSPGDFVVTLEHGRIYCSDLSNIAVISKDNYLLDEVSFQWGNDEIISAQYNTIFSLKGFVKPTVYKGRVFSLLSGGAAKHYYYHWLFETLPKLFLLRQSGHLNDVDYFIVPSTALKFQQEYLRHFGITQDKIINEEKVHHIQAELLMVTSHIKYKDHHSKWVCEFLYQSFFKSQSVGTPTRKIYISRGDAARNRRVHNEEQLIEMLRGYGFESYYLSSLTIDEQAKLFNSASVIVAPHGGGLSNLVYCQPGTKVLEFFPDQYVRHIFYDVANKAGLEYQYLIFQSDGTADNSVEGQTVGIKVDIDVIRRKVQTLLSLQKVY